MRTRLVPWAALLGLALLSGAARPDEATAAKPTAILRLASVDSLREDLRHLGEVAGKQGKLDLRGLAKQLDHLVKELTKSKGLAGIDTTKPIGAYGTVGPMGLDSTGVVLLPIADEKDFLALVENLSGNKPTKDGNLYTVEIEMIPFPVYFRFADKYCYVTVKDRDVLDKDKLLAPAIVLPAGKIGTLSATVNIDAIPDNLKEIALGQIDRGLGQVKAKEEPNETPARAKLKAAILDEISLTIKSLLREGGAVDLHIDLDRSAGNLTVTAGLAGKPNSPLAANIADLGKVKSMTAALIGTDSALGGLIDVSLPNKLKSAALALLGEVEEKALAKRRNKIERDILQAVVNAAKPTLEGGILDAGIDLRGPNPDGIYTAVAGVKVKDGEMIDKNLHKIVAELPPEVRELIKLDFDKVDKAVIHRVTARGDGDSKIPLGDNPIFVAVRDDALLLAAGDKGLEALKEALGSPAKAGPVARVELSATRFAPLMEKDHPGAVKAAHEAFAKDKDADKVRITLEGGQALQVRLTAKTPLIKFLVLLGKLKEQ
jgi:hypothetical protein